MASTSRVLSRRVWVRCAVLPSRCAAALTSHCEGIAEWTATRSDNAQRGRGAQNRGERAEAGKAASTTPFRLRSCATGGCAGIPSKTAHGSSKMQLSVRCQSNIAGYNGIPVRMTVTLTMGKSEEWALRRPLEQRGRAAARRRLWLCPFVRCVSSLLAACPTTRLAARVAAACSACSAWILARLLVRVWEWSPLAFRPPFVRLRSSSALTHVQRGGRGMATQHDSAHTQDAIRHGPDGGGVPIPGDGWEQQTATSDTAALDGTHAWVAAGMCRQTRARIEMSSSLAGIPPIGGMRGGSGIGQQETRAPQNWLSCDGRAR